MFISGMGGEGKFLTTSVLKFSIVSEKLLEHEVRCATTLKIAVPEFDVLTRDRWPASPPNFF